MIDDIVIWNNNPEISLSFPEDRIKVIASDRNLVTYGRYLATQAARHDIIYTQDDDCLVGNIPELIQTFHGDPTRMAHALKLGHLLANPQNVRDGAHMALLGWGAVFHRSWVSVLDEYRARFGEDQFLVRDADRLFSILQGRWHRTLIADVIDLPGCDGPEAMSTQSEHIPVTQQAIEQGHRFLKEKRMRAGGVASSTDSEHQKSSHPAPKSQAYYECDRPEVLALIPLTSRQTLDIGCGAGYLGAALKRRQNVHVTGVELQSVASAAASQRLDRVLTIDAQADAQCPQSHGDSFIARRKLDLRICRAPG